MSTTRILLRNLCRLAAGAAVIPGPGGDDIINSLDGADTICGSTGADAITGGDTALTGVSPGMGTTPFSATTTTIYGDVASFKHVGRQTCRPTGGTWR